jgi:hypothetical protein
VKLRVSIAGINMNTDNLDVFHKTLYIQAFQTITHLIQEFWTLLSLNNNIQPEVVLNDEKYPPTLDVKINEQSFNFHPHMFLGGEFVINEYTRETLFEFILDQLFDLNISIDLNDTIVLQNLESYGIIVEKLSQKPPSYSINISEGIFKENSVFTLRTITLPFWEDNSQSPFTFWKVGHNHIAMSTKEIQVGIVSLPGIYWSDYPDYSGWDYVEGLTQETFSPYIPKNHEDYRREYFQATDHLMILSE